MCHYLKKFSVVRLEFITDAATCLLKNIGAPAISFIASYVTSERC